MYERVEKELKEMQQAIHSICTLPTTPSSSQVVELGDEPAQL
jgi:hypothetical protein